MKSAIVTGAAGQDGSFLAESLLEKGYEVHGLVRPSTRHEIRNLKRAEESAKFHRHEVDLLETAALVRLVRDVRPDEFYNLAACSFVPASWDIPDYVCEVNGMAPLRILEAIRAYSPETRFYQAGSSEMFGQVFNRDEPLHENSYHYPRSPYGASKSFAHNIARNYRESFGMHVTNGILFNHESERRDVRFVTRKVTMGVAKWSETGIPLDIGNMDSVRDWGYSPDYVEAMQMMVRHDTPGDWVVSTGVARTVRKFVETAFSVLGHKVSWSGRGLDEVGVVDGKVAVRVDPKYYRPAEVEFLQGDSRKIRTELGWSERTTFQEMVRRMVRQDVKFVKVLA